MCVCVCVLREWGQRMTSDSTVQGRIKTSITRFSSLTICFLEKRPRKHERDWTSRSNRSNETPAPHTPPPSGRRILKLNANIILK